MEECSCTETGALMKASNSLSGPKWPRVLVQDGFGAFSTTGCANHTRLHAQPTTGLTRFPVRLRVTRADNVTRLRATSRKTPDRCEAHPRKLPRHHRVGGED